MNRATGSARTEALRLGAVAAVGAFVAFWRLGVLGWGVDEIVYAEAGRAYARGDFSLNRGHGWLSKELIGLSTRLIGDGEIGVRLPGAVLGFLTGFVLYALARRLGGPRAALVAGALWWLLPQAPGVHPVRLDRYGTLEPAMTFFAVAALYAAWRWGERGDWRWGVAAAGCLGLSASAKFTGALFAPAVALPLLWMPVAWSRRALQAGVAAVAGVVGVVLPYLADGLSGVGALVEGIELQFANNSQGHLQLVAGTVYQKPPWWSHLWWQAQYLGWPATVALWALTVVGLGAAWRSRALASSGWPLAVFLSAALVFPALPLLTSPRKLPHYHLVLIPLLAVAAGLAAASWLFTRNKWRNPPLIAWGNVGAVACLVPLGIAAAVQVVRVATLQPDAYRIAAARLEAAGLAGEDVLVFGYGDVLKAEVPTVRIVPGVPAELPEALVVDPVWRDRFRDSDIDRYVTSVAPEYDRSRAGRLTLYVRRSP